MRSSTAYPYVIGCEILVNSAVSSSEGGVINTRQIPIPRKQSRLVACVEAKKRNVPQDRFDSASGDVYE